MADHRSWKGVEEERGAKVLFNGYRVFQDEKNSGIGSLIKRMILILWN